ncbi:MULTISPECIES: hypothetical protein [unclassified Acinetobacter]|uniref:hypothetical protein n=1 Tax=unclassified Acinetobacter TaxID=196816 RepID=UPI0035B73CB1
MKKILMALTLALAFTLPNVAMAKGILIFNTGDEIFEIKNAPTFDDGFKLGYACKHFGLLWADVWTWDCQMMAVNPDRNEVADLPADMKQQFQSQFSESDRDRGFWNRFGIFILALIFIGYGIFNMRGSNN